MLNFVKIAWRNLWRNRRRTFITVASVMFAIVFALIMRAFQLGSYNHMVNNLVHSFSGYFQVHGKGYWDDQVLNNSMEQSRQLDSLISGFPELEAAPRLESFVLVSYGQQTKGALLNGVVPDAEDALTSVYNKLVDGSFIGPDDDGAMVSSKLASFLKVSVGDTLVVIGQGYHGASAAGTFVIKGILKFPSPELDKQMVYISLPAAQELFSAQGRLTSIAFNMKNPEHLPGVIEAIRSRTDSSLYEVMDWKQMMPEMVQQIEGDNASGLIMLGILYMIVGFGILGTVLMMTTERTREFGVMIAIGMQKSKLIIIQVIEMLIIGIMGVLSGIALALPIIYYYLFNPIQLSGSMADAMIEFGFEPIMPVLLRADYFVSQAMVIMIFVFVAAFIPAFSVGRLTVIKALRR